MIQERLDDWDKVVKAELARIQQGLREEVDWFVKDLEDEIKLTQGGLHHKPHLGTGDSGIE